MKTNQPLTLILYPKCSTCMKAKKFLSDQGISFQMRHIAEDTPSITELKTWMALTDQPLSKLFNTHGQAYREQDLKSKIPTMDEDTMYALLAGNGMLIKRPLLVGPDFFLIGFQEAAWSSYLSKM